MGLLDFFRPAWRHSNPDIRLEAVRSLTEEDATTLSEVVIKDPDVRVRRAALKKVREPEVLFDVAAREADATLKELASERAQELLLEASLSADGKHGLSPEDAAKKLEGNQNLIRVACYIHSN